MQKDNSAPPRGQARLGRRALLACLPMLAAAPAAFAQVVIPSASLDIFETPTATHRLAQRLATLPDGAVYRLFSAIPVQAPPAAGYPILYALDGNAAFDLLTPETLALAPDLVIAGIGYDTHLRFAVEERALDYTPPLPGGGVAPDPARPGRLLGGAEQFMSRLTGPLRAEIEAGLPVDPRRRTLLGHSLAGLFALHGLLIHPQAFRRYAAISPSIWWGGDRLPPADHAAPDADSTMRELLVALGDREQRSGSTGPAPTGPAPQTLEFVERLSERGDIRVRLEVLRGRQHGETFAASLPSALGFAISGLPA